MKLASYLLVAVLFFALAAPAKKIRLGKKKVWRSETTNSDATALVECVTNLHDMLDKKPRSSFEALVNMSQVRCSLLMSSPFSK